MNSSRTHRGAAARARTAGLPVDRERPVEVPGGAVHVDVQRVEAGPARRERLGHDLGGGVEHPGHLAASQGVGGAGVVQPRPPERLVGVDVADARHQRLVEQCALDAGALARARPRRAPHGRRRGRAGRERCARRAPGSPRPATRARPDGRPAWARGPSRRDARRCAGRRSRGGRRRPAPDARAGAGRRRAPRRGHGRAAGRSSPGAPGGRARRAGARGTCPGAPRRPGAGRSASRRGHRVRRPAAGRCSPAGRARARRRGPRRAVRGRRAPSRPRAARASTPGARGTPRRPRSAPRSSSRCRPPRRAPRR